MWRRLGWVLGGLFVAIALSAFALDRYGRRGPPRETFDAIVVLGCRVHAGGVASEALRLRTLRAVGLWREGRAPLIVLTGGVGDHGPSEASVAAAIARGMGVPESALRVEDRSTSTEENARFTAERFGGRRVLLVSDAYHVFRAERVFRKYFEHVRGTGTVAASKTRLYGSVREVAACAIYLGLGRMRARLDELEGRARPQPTRHRATASPAPCIVDETCTVEERERRTLARSAPRSRAT